MVRTVLSNQFFDLIRVNSITQCQCHNMSLNWSILQGYIFVYNLVQ